MNTVAISDTLSTLMRELVHGSSDVSDSTYMLNRGDRGLLDALDKLPASAASASNAGGPSIAAHTDHVRYGLSLLNRWAGGNRVPWKDTDWTASWKKIVVSDAEWRALRDDLRRETDAWIAALAAPREVNVAELSFITGSVSHLAYHFGAIRQIDRATRGPTAEEERQAEAKLRAEK